MDAPTAAEAAIATATDPAPFDALDEALRRDGAAAALDALARTLTERGDYRALLDALLLKARHELGLPTIPGAALAELPEPGRSAYEERYVEAIRHVGALLLEAGDIPGAWPYFRAIGEKEPVAEALERYQPDEADEALGQVVEVAFTQGAHPRRGFELILDHYGICSAITAFEHLPPDPATRVACAGRLVRALHAQLAANLRAEIARRGQPSPKDGAPIPALVDGRDWLFADENYHVDTSHLSAVVRLAPILDDAEALALAVELTEYGRRLSPRYHHAGEPPFERPYEDHGLYLGALLGRDADAAVARLRAQLPPPDPDPEAEADPDAPAADSLPAQFLVRLLARLGRLDEAIDVAAEHLAELPDAGSLCPSLAQLCRRAGRPDRLARSARRRGDLVRYAAARLADPQAP